MNTTITSEIQKHYHNKREKAVADLDKRKEKIYSDIPVLSEIDDKISKYSMKCLKSMLVCEPNDRDSYVKSLEQEIDNLHQIKTNVLKEHNIEPSELEPQFECTKCNDTGFIQGKQCSCYQQLLLNYSYDNSNLQTFADHTFENFKLDLYSTDVFESTNISPYKNMEYIKKLAINFVNEFNNPAQKNLFFTGGTGLGKTYLSSCIANELLKKGKTVLYQTAPKLLDTAMEHKFNKQSSSNTLYQQLFDVDLLIIDDLGVEFLNNLTSTELFNIINSRLISPTHIRTIVSTNLDLNSFNERYDARLVSRIIGGFTICKFLGDDIRLKKR